VHELRELRARQRRLQAGMAGTAGYSSKQVDKKHWIAGLGQTPDHSGRRSNDEATTRDGVG